ncbi:MAG TPA: hypothetical protein PKV43_11975 [Armatimonadota bacterium]|nr:hypothetical protein [Armatimonadota bacterium]
MEKQMAHRNGRMKVLIAAKERKLRDQMRQMSVISALDLLRRTLLAS